MRRWLDDLENYAVILLTALGRLRDQTTGSLGVAFGPRIPIALNVSSMLDPRTSTSTPPDDADPVGWEPHDQAAALTATIHQLAADRRHAREESEPRTWTLVGELRYLRTQLAGVAMERTVGNFFEQLAGLHRAARAAAHDQPRDLGPCLMVGCDDGRVHWLASQRRVDGEWKIQGTGEDRARCTGCLTVYSGLDLVRLAAHTEATA
jgi:hypothetical protein